MAPRPAYRLVKPEDRQKVGPKAFKPEASHRQLVEFMVSVGASEEQICREFRRLSIPCKNRPQLRKHFKDELANGKERRVLGYALKMHSIAMSDAPGNQSALRFMLGVIGGRMWQNVHWREDEMPPVTQTSQEVVHFYMPPNGRDVPDDEDGDEGPIIEGEADAA